jgi:hypothetical protein
MKLRKQKLWTTTNAVALPLEALVAFGIVIITIAFLLTSISGFFSPYVKAETDLNYKILDVCELLLKSPGMTTYGSPHWETDFNNLSVLGLAMAPAAYRSNASEIKYTDIATRIELQNPDFLYPTTDFHEYYTGWRPSLFDYVYIYSGSIYHEMINESVFTYAALNQSKIDVLRDNISYEDAKQALGLGVGYDFNLTITSYTLGLIVQSNETLPAYGPSYANAQVIIPYTRTVTIYPDKAAILRLYMFR